MTKARRFVTVHDEMQDGYQYELVARPGQDFDDEGAGGFVAGCVAFTVAAGVGQGQGSAGAAPGSVEEALAALKLTLELGAGTVNDVNTRNETPLHGVMYRGGSLELIDFLVARGATLESVVNSRGWTALRIADGVALDGIAFIRYPETAAHLRALMRAKGLEVPPVESDGPQTAAAR